MLRNLLQSLRQTPTMVLVAAAGEVRYGKCSIFPRTLDLPWVKMWGLHHGPGWQYRTSSLMMVVVSILTLFLSFVAELRIINISHPFLSFIFMLFFLLSLYWVSSYALLYCLKSSRCILSPLKLCNSCVDTPCIFTRYIFNTYCSKFSFIHAKQY